MTMLTIALLALAAPAPAQPRDVRTPVVQAAQALFDALAKRDEAALLAATMPEGVATSVLIDKAGQTKVSHWRWAEFARMLQGGRERLEERMFDPEVRVDGAIASVWTRYDFRIDGKRTHCGTDHFDLVIKDGRWRILNVTWTRQTEGCENR